MAVKSSKVFRFILSLNTTTRGGYTIPYITALYYCNIHQNDEMKLASSSNEMFTTLNVDLYENSEEIDIRMTILPSRSSFFFYHNLITVCVALLMK